MIEVEKKILLAVGDEQRLLDGARFVRERKINDVYYDNNTHDLMRKDTWLRDRDGRFELKVPLNANGRSRNELDLYEEFDSEDEIVAILKLSEVESLRTALQVAGYDAVVPFVTKRKTYAIDDFTIVVDEADFGYRLAEVEMMVEKRDDVDSASAKIMDFVTSRGISIDMVPGKLPMYIEKNLPELYAILVDEGVF